MKKLLLWIGLIAGLILFFTATGWPQNGYYDPYDCGCGYRDRYVNDPYAPPNSYAPRLWQPSYLEEPEYYDRYILEHPSYDERHNPWKYYEWKHQREMNKLRQQMYYERLHERLMDRIRRGR